MPVDSLLSNILRLFSYVLTYLSVLSLTSSRGLILIFVREEEEEEETFCFLLHLLEGVKGIGELSSRAGAPSILCKRSKCN
jgi:hypothetical protein